MSAAQVPRTLAFDHDLVETVGDDPETLSATVNAALRTTIDQTEHHRRRTQFDAYVADLVNVFGEPDPQVRASVAAIFDSVSAQD